MWSSEVSIVPPKNVVKDYNRNLPCGKAANQVMAAIEGNFARFGNFTTRGPLGTSESVTFRPSGTLQAGSSIPITVQVGATIGLTAWFAPMLVGGGDDLTQAILSGRYLTKGLAFIFVLRFFIGPWSYAAGTPGGLFAPMLVLGASFGALFGEVLNFVNPHMGISTLACAIVGMGTLFSACVRL